MIISPSTIQALVGKHVAVFSAPPRKTVTPSVTDAPLLGNGDFGAAIAGDGSKLIFLLGKNDFWKQVHLNETTDERLARLRNDTGRRTGTRRVALGYLEISLPQLKDCSYRQDQDILNAEVRGSFCKGDAGLVTCAWIAAQQNLLAVELANTGVTDLEVDFCIMPGPYGNAEVFGYKDGAQTDVVWFDYPADPQTARNRREVTVAATCTAAGVEYFPNKLMRKGGRFHLPSGGSVRILLTAVGDLDSPRHFDDALAQVRAARADLDGIKSLHRTWWHDFWGRSLVDTGGDVLNKYYYGSLYLLAASTRSGKTPPGLWGPWVGTDTPSWTGSYTINYNYEAPFWCLYASNRQQLAESYLDPLLAIIPIGRFFAKEFLGHRGVYLPVELGPWGTVCNRLFFNQKSNAAFLCTNLLMHFYSTYDRAWAQKAYPFLKEVAEFWVDDLVFENGRYNAVKDAIHEKYTGEGDTNNLLTLGLLRMFFRGILDVADFLEIEPDERSKWEHILAALAPFPVFERNGRKVFRYAVSFRQRCVAVFSRGRA